MNREELLAKKASGVVLSAEEEAFLASSEPESTPDTTQQTNQPPAPVTDPARERYINVLEATLREQNRQIQELQNVRTTPAPVAPTVDPEEEKQRFYNDPVNTTRSIIEESLRSAIEPLNQFVRGLKIEGSPYSQMLNKFRADARFVDALNDQQVVSAVEKIMEKAELSDINMQSAIVHAMGLKTMGLLGTIAAPSDTPAPTPAPAPAPTPAPTSGNGGTVVPAHVRPSAAPTPQPSNNNPTRRPPMTENQRRLMREQGFKTEEEYWKWMELPAGEVAHTEFDRPPQGGK
jgi:hypothetical protein